MSEARSAAWRGLTAALLLGGLALRLCTFLDYGVTWDEQLERRTAALTLSWYSSGFQDTSFLQDDQRIYGSFFDVLVWLCARVSPFGYYETGHLVTAILGWLATLMAYRLGADLGGPRAGFLAAAALTLTPVFHGHSFNNPKDAPFAALFLTALALALRAFRSPSPPTLARLLGVGVAIGLAAGVRIVGLSLLLVPAALLLRRAMSSTGDRPAPGWKRPARQLAIATLAAVATMLPWWPYLLLAPLEGTREVFSRLGTFESNPSVLFEGQQISANALPRRYLPVWLLISLPEFYFVALSAGAWLALQAIRQGRASRGFDTLLVVATAVAPVAAAVVLRSRLYDGLRHVLFVLPLFAVLAGLSLDAIARQQSRWAKRLVLALAAVSSAQAAVEMWRLHPYQSIFFNQVIAGGLGQASQRFETDYWGSSYKEGVGWLVANYHPEDAERRKVANVSNKFLTAYYLERPEAQARFEAVRQPGKADIVLATTRWNLHRSWPGRILYTVEREGVGLCYVIERSGGAATSRGPG